MVREQCPTGGVLVFSISFRLCVRPDCRLVEQCLGRPTRKSTLIALVGRRVLPAAGGRRLLFCGFRRSKASSANRIWATWRYCFISADDKSRKNEIAMEGHRQINSVSNFRSLGPHCWNNLIRNRGIDLPNTGAPTRCSVAGFSPA